MSVWINCFYILGFKPLGGLSVGLYNSTMVIIAIGHPNKGWTELKLKDSNKLNSDIIFYHPIMNQNI